MSVIPNLDTMLKQNFSIGNSTKIISSVSDKYVAIDTLEVIELLNEQGFVPYKWTKSDKIFSKHSIDFKKNDNTFFEVTKGDIIKPTVHLSNSNDKSMAFSLNIGFNRLVCSNGLKTFDAINEVKSKHIGEKAEDIVLSFFNNFHTIVNSRLELIGTMDEIILTEEQKSELILKGLEYRYSNNPTRFQEIIKSKDLKKIITSIGTSNNSFDRGNTLWKVFNTTQENLTHGNYSFNNKKARKISSQFQDLRFNTKLWNSAVELI